MKAINHYVVIEKIKEAPKKVGGLELTEDQNKDIRYLITFNVKELDLHVSLYVSLYVSLDT